MICIEGSNRNASYWKLVFGSKLVDRSGWFKHLIRAWFQSKALQSLNLVMLRQIATAGAIAAAVGGPYVATETDLGRSLSSQVTQVFDTTASSVKPLDSDGNAHHATEKLWDERIGPRDLEHFHETELKTLAGGPIADFREVLRFDITPSWVDGHFARVTTVLSDLQLEGLRVPIVTGTRPDDIAGTVTYFFRHDHQLQRVTMHGFTGDPTRMINLMTQFYGMKQRPTLDTGVYTIDWNGSPTSVLKVTRAPVMYADATRNQHTIFLELNQPHMDYGLSPEAKQIVNADWSTGRW